MKFSTLTQGFYPDDATTPADLIPISDADYQKGMEGRPEGSLLEIQNGTLVITPPVLTIAEAKTAQMATLRMSYQSAIYADIQYTSVGGVSQTFQADAGSVTLLGQQLDVYVTAGAPLPSGYAWAATDNTQVPFTVADLKGLAAAIGNRGAAAFFHLQAQKAAVRTVAATAGATVADIQAITW